MHEFADALKYLNRMPPAKCRLKCQFSSQDELLNLHLNKHPYTVIMQVGTQYMIIVEMKNANRNDCREKPVLPKATNCTLLHQGLHRDFETFAFISGTL